MALEIDLNEDAPHWLTAKREETKQNNKQQSDKAKAETLAKLKRILKSKKTNRGKADG